MIGVGLGGGQEKNDKCFVLYTYGVRQLYTVLLTHVSEQSLQFTVS